MVTTGMVRAGKALRTRQVIMWGLLLPDFCSCFLMFWETRRPVTQFQALGRCLVPRGEAATWDSAASTTAFAWAQYQLRHNGGFNKQQVMLSPMEPPKPLIPQRLGIMLNDCRLTRHLGSSGSLSFLSVRRSKDPSGKPSKISLAQGLPLLLFL